MNERALPLCTETNVVLYKPCICEIQQPIGCYSPYLCLEKRDGTRVCSKYECPSNKLEPELCICKMSYTAGSKVHVCYSGTLCVEEQSECLVYCTIGGEFSAECACKQEGLVYNACRSPKRCVYSYQQHNKAVCVSYCNYGEDGGESGCFCQSGTSSYLYCGSGQYCLLKDGESGFSQCYSSCADASVSGKCGCQEVAGTMLCESAYLCLGAQDKRCMALCRPTSAGSLSDVRDCACEIADGYFEVCQTDGFCLLGTTQGLYGRCYASYCSSEHTDSPCPCLTDPENVYLCAAGEMCIYIETGFYQCLAACPLEEATDNLCYCGLGTEAKLCGGISACFADQSARLSCLDICVPGEYIQMRDCLCRDLNNAVTLCRTNDVCSVIGDVVLVCHESCDECIQSASSKHCKRCVRGFYVAGDGECIPCADVCAVCADATAECVNCGYTEEAKLKCENSVYNDWMIGGLTAGLAIVLIIIVVVIICCCKRRNQSSSAVEQANALYSGHETYQKEADNSKEEVGVAIP